MEESFLLIWRPVSAPFSVAGAVGGLGLGSAEVGPGLWLGGAFLHSPMPSLPPEVREKQSSIPPHPTPFQSTPLHFAPLDSPLSLSLAYPLPEWVELVLGLRLSLGLGLGWSWVWAGSGGWDGLGLGLGVGWWAQLGWGWG